VEIHGHDLVASPVAARAGLGYLPQSAEIFGYLTVRGFLETVAALRHSDVAEPLARAAALIHARCLDQRIDTLSAGQRRKLCLCAALTGRPRVLLLDEPDAALDDAAVAELVGELSALEAEGRAAIVATHHDLVGAAPRGTLVVRDGHVGL
jgi:ABC-type multidrug transport system ATPase subunit